VKGNGTGRITRTDIEAKLRAIRDDIEPVGEQAKGGLMAAATVKLRPLENVERPAIATVLPTPQKCFLLLDAGANAECKPVHLAQFAIMGSVYSREILGSANPRVGILSNGKEETKGNDLMREALGLCRQLELNFLGYVEGHDLFGDHVDVVVTDGLIGNIVLKTCEGMGRAIGVMLKTELTQTQIAIQEAAGVVPKLFRPPLGLSNPRIFRVARALGLTVVGWTARGFDTKLTDPNLIVARIIRKLQPSAIILLHDGNIPADRLVTTVKILLDTLRGLDYEVARLDKVLT